MGFFFNSMFGEKLFLGSVKVDLRFFYRWILRSLVKVFYGYLRWCLRFSIVVG